MLFPGFCAVIATSACFAIPHVTLEFGDIPPPDTGAPMESRAADAADFPFAAPTTEARTVLDSMPPVDVLPAEEDLAFAGHPSPDPLWAADVLAGEIDLARGLAPPGAMPPPRTTVGQSDETCLALAIYHEARGESEAGQEAVASVVLQRVAVSGRWGETVCEVVSPNMFSFVAQDLSLPGVDEPEAWARAEALSRRMILAGPLLEMAGADHYHADYAHPSWRHAMRRVKQIGTHIFYADPRSRPTL